MEVALRNILSGVQGNGGDFAESRYFKQLRVLAQLRKLDIKFIEAMETITKYFKEEKDPLYRRGEAKGKAEVVENLIVKLGLSDEQIAEVAEVTLDFVKKIRASLKKK